MGDLNSIFNKSHCVSHTQMLNYILQKLDRDEAYLVESHLSDCQFCNDALEALLESNTTTVSKDIAEVKDALLKKFEPETKPVIIPGNEKPLKHNVQPTILNKVYSRWLAAAGVLLLIGLGGYSVFSYIQSHKKEISLKEGKTGKKEDAVYSKSEDAQDEIVRIKVQPNDTFGNYAATDSKEKGSAPAPTEKLSPVATSKPNPEIKTVQGNEPLKKELAAGENKINEPEALPATAKDDAPQMETAPGMDNFIRGQQEEKTLEKTTQSISKKKSAGGLKNDRDNTQNNQLSFPKNERAQNAAPSNVAQNYESNNAANEIVASDYEQGMDLFNKQNYNQSISYFEKALKKSTGTEKEDIQYHLALAYLRSGKERKATKMFAELEKSKKYGEQAAKEIRQLEMKK